MNMNVSLPEVIYKPESRIRHPLRLVKEMFSDLWKSQGLAWRLFVRDIKAQYRQTVLGLLWAFFPPIITTVTFVILNSSKVLDIAGGTNIPYPAFVLMGTIFWDLFSGSLVAPINNVQMAKQMLSKINFPQEALILSGIGKVLFNFFIKVLLLFPVFWWFKVSVAHSVVLVPVAALFLLLFGTMLGLLFVPISMLYTDFSRILAFITTFWMLVTPVVYPPTQEGILGIISKLNPVSPLIVTAKGWLVEGFGADTPAFWVVSGVTLVFLFLGWISYKLSMPIIIERMQA